MSQATVSRRLRLVQPNMPVDLAGLAGRKVEERVLEPLFEVLDDKQLVEVGDAAVLAEIERDNAPSDGFRLLEVMTDAWFEAKLAVPTTAECFSSDVREDDDFKRAAKGSAAFTVKCAQPHDPRSVQKYEFYRCMDAAVAAQEVSDRLEAERRAAEEKLAAKAAKQGKKVKALPDGSKLVVEAPKKRSLQERVPEQCTRAQLDLMTRHVPAQIAFPDDLVAEALDHFVAHTPALLSNMDREAACRALGLPLPDQKESRRDNLHFQRGDFLARWKKDPVEDMKLVAVALFFQAGDYHKQLEDGATGYDHGQGIKEPRLPVWLTGKTFEEATELAKQVTRTATPASSPCLTALPATIARRQRPCTGAGSTCAGRRILKEVDMKDLATRRLRRAAEARQPPPGPPSPQGEVGQPKTAPEIAPKEAPAAGGAGEAVGQPAAADAKPPLFKRKGRKAAGA